MHATTDKLTIERAAAVIVGLSGTAATVLLLTHDSRTASMRGWLLLTLAILGAAVPLITLPAQRTSSHRLTQVVFPLAAACQAAVLGASKTIMPLKIPLGLSIAISLLMCIRAALLRAEAAENRPRNRF